jgi:hypothetical protein
MVYVRPMYEHVDDFGSQGWEPDPNAPFVGYCAWGTDFEGRKSDVIGYFLVKGNAELAASFDKGAGRGPVTQVTFIRSPSGEVYLLADPKPLEVDKGIPEMVKEAREKALAKLSPADRVALGV